MRSNLNRAPLPIGNNDSGDCGDGVLVCRGRSGDLQTAWHILQSRDSMFAVRMLTLILSTGVLKYNGSNVLMELAGQTASLSSTLAENGTVRKTY